MVENNLDDFLLALADKWYFNDFNTHDYGSSGEQGIANLLVMPSLFGKTKENYMITPCYRSEKRELITRGTHLSYFYMAIVHLVHIDYDRVTKIINAWLCIKNRNWIENRLSSSIAIRNERLETYVIRPSEFTTANNFNYFGAGIEITNAQGLEIGGVYKVFSHNDQLANKPYGLIGAFGLERLLMNIYNVTSIWDTPVFKIDSGRIITNVDKDLFRGYCLNGQKQKSSNCDDTFLRTIIDGSSLISLTNACTRTK